MKITLNCSLSLISLSLLVACGGGSGGGSGQQENASEIQNEVIMPDGSNVSGLYRADLVPMNYNLHFKEVGTTSVKRQDDAFTATVDLKYGPKQTKHRQAIYTGRRCPNLLDDLNKDAYIDINEARIALGAITIPLDSNLDSQELGDYPSSDATGAMVYQMNASFSRMFADLKTSDSNPNDNIIKLPENDGITFPGRVVLIQGVGSETVLPKTVSTNATGSEHETLPVACGILWKVVESEGER